MRWILKIFQEQKNGQRDYLINNIHINFVHYKTFQDGVNAWKRRVKRINKKKMFFIFVETDGCTYEDLLRFDNLSNPNKIALTYKPYSKMCISNQRI